MFQEIIRKFVNKYRTNWQYIYEERYVKGRSLASIGKDLGLSRERVRTYQDQIYKHLVKDIRRAMYSEKYIEELSNIRKNLSSKGRKSC